MCGPGPCTSPTPCGRCERGAPERTDAPLDRRADAAAGRAAGAVPVRAPRSLTVLSQSADDRLTAG
jgi:hypothetical protein